jgi:hypothetical protein
MDLETELRDLGRSLDHPAGDGVVDALRRELADAGPDEPRSLRPGRVPWWAAAAAAVVTVLVVGSAWWALRGDDGATEATPPPRRSDAAATTTTTTPPPAALATVDLATARTAVEIPIRVPEGVTVVPRVTLDRRAPGGLVALEYPTFTVVEVAAPAGASAGKIAGLGPESQVRPVAVRDQPGLWITGTHPEISYLDREGTARRGPVRTHGHVLMWVEDGVTYRVEGFHDQDAAMRVANSLR